MISYLIKSGLCLAILLAFYHLVLEREKMHQFNRFYLLGSVLFSFWAPSYIIYVEAKNVIQSVVEIQERTEVMQLSFFEQYITWQNGLFFIYILISVVLLIRFIKNLYQILNKIRTNEVVKKEHAKFVPVADEIQPHTFWNYIFINKEDYSNQKIEEELYTHELAHVTQRHTIDVLIIEILQVLFWFNPFFFLLKKAIQLNHEFLADDKVISSHQNIPRYQTLLLSKASWQNEYYLASNLNYSLTKKRLLMMKTQNSKNVIFLKKIAVIPLLAGLVFLVANRVEAQTKKEKKPVVVQVKEIKATKSEMNEYKTILREGAKTNKFNLRDVKRAKYLYSLMSREQKRAVDDINEIVPPPPPKPPKKVYVKEVKAKKDGKPPKPYKIEVVEISKKPKKAPKSEEFRVVKVLKKGKKSPKPPKKAEEIKEEKELKEVIEAEEVEETVEVTETIVEEVTEHPEVKEVVEIIEEKHEHPEVEIIEVLKEKEQETVRLSDQFKKFKKQGAKFYVNGKKVSAKKASKIATYEIDRVDFMKGKKNEAGKVYIYTKLN